MTSPASTSAVESAMKLHLLWLYLLWRAFAQQPILVNTYYGYTYLGYTYYGYTSMARYTYCGAPSRSSQYSAVGSAVKLAPSPAQTAVGVGSSPGQLSGLG